MITISLQTSLTLACAHANASCSLTLIRKRMFEGKMQGAIHTNGAGITNANDTP